MTKLYTKNGDKGYTQTLNNKHISECDVIIELIGTLDEFSSCLGVAKVHIKNDVLLRDIELLQKKLQKIFLLALGKAIDSITTNINEVTVYGDQDVIDEMDYLPVEIDVAGLNQDKNYEVIISKPSGVRDLSETNIKVNIKVAEEVTKEINDVSIETINLSDNFKAAAVGANSSKTSVVIKGAKSVIDSIDESMIKAQVDLEGYAEGEYEVAVNVVGEENKATYTPKTTKIKIKISKK